MLAPNPSQHLESQSVSQRNPSRFHQSVKRSRARGAQASNFDNGGISNPQQRALRQGRQINPPRCDVLAQVAWPHVKSRRVELRLRAVEDHGRQLADRFPRGAEADRTQPRLVGARCP